MISAAFDLGEKMKLHTVEYMLHPDLWKRYTVTQIDIRFSKWTKIKYLNKRGNKLHTDVENIPGNTGGIYLFYIECPIISGITEFPFYVGRAQFTQTQNLKKRCKEYFQKYSKSDERPKITRMFKYWGKALCLAYLPINTNNNIVNLEKELINSLLLPMNDEIPDQIIRQGVKAFK